MEFFDYRRKGRCVNEIQARLCRPAAPLQALSKPRLPAELVSLQDSFACRTRFPARTRLPASLIFLQDSFPCKTRLPARTRLPAKTRFPASLVSQQRTFPCKVDLRMFRNCSNALKPTARTGHFPAWRATGINVRAWRLLDQKGKSLASRTRRDDQPHGASLGLIVGLVKRPATRRLTNNIPLSPHGKTTSLALDSTFVI